MKFFEEIILGEKVEFEVDISKEIHEKFSELSGDFSKMHTDDEFSKSKGFKKKIGYAFLLNSFLSRLYGEHLPGGSSICLKQESKFMNPFYEGDKLRIVGEVISKSESTKVVEINSEIFNQDNQKIFEGNGWVKIIVEKGEGDKI